MAGRRLINATHDITEKDLVMLNWHRLKCEAATHKVLKEAKKEKISVLRWIFCFIVNEEPK